MSWTEGCHEQEKAGPGHTSETGPGLTTRRRQDAMDRKSFWATMPDSCKADAYAGYNCLYGPEGATEGLLGALPAQVL